MSSAARSFDAVPDAYDEFRPGYPEALYAELERVCGPLSGRRVLDLAAGSGLATRELRRRGADVMAVDPSEPMLRRLRDREPTTAVVAAAAEALPLRDDTVDVVTCATAWHWLDFDKALAEVRRVLRPGGRLALFWANHQYAADVDWEAAQEVVYRRWQRSMGSYAVDDRSTGPWQVADDLRRRGLPVVAEHRFEWTRELTRADHLALLATHSTVLTLPEADRRSFMAEVEDALSPWQTVTERIHGPLVVVEPG